MKSSLRAAALVLVAGTVTAHGAILQWDALFSGNASTANNWNPNQRPTAVDDLRFDSVLNNNYTVTYDSLVSTVRSHQYLGDNVTIRVTNAAGHTITNSMSIENASEVLFDVGRLNVPGTTSVGALSAAAGSLTIDQTLFTGGALNAGPIGGGDILLLHGARAEVGAVTLNSGSTLRAQDSSLLQATSFGIGTTGNSTASVAEFINGSDATISGDMNIATGAGTTALVKVIDGTPFGAPVVQINGNLRVAANSTAAAAGNGTLLIQMPVPGQFPSVFSGNLFVGDLNGGQGTVRIDGGDFTCEDATFVPGHSSLVVRAGSFRSTGVFAWTGSFTPFPVPPETTGHCSVSLHGTSLITGNVHLSADFGGNLDYGGTGTTGRITGDVVLAEHAGSVGRVSVHDGAETTFEGTTVVGQRGDGELFVGSANAFVQDVSVAAEIGSVGEVRVLNGNLNVVTGGLWIGGTSTLAGGTGRLTISLFGGVNVPGNMRVRGGGTIDIQPNGNLNVGSTLQTSPGAELLIESGQIQAHTLAFSGASVGTLDGVDLTGSGNIIAEISATGSGNNIVATGPLTLGRSTMLVSYHGMNIDLSVGAHTVTLRGVDGAVVGDTTIAGGTLATTGTIHVPPGKTISGGGTIDAPTISNVGTINATTPQGFVIKGIVTATGSLTGTLFDFSNSGGFTGTGTINSQIRGSAGSVITATGNLTLGTATSTGFSFDGTLRTNANQVTLRDTSTAAIGNVELAGGSLFCTDTDLSSDLNDVASGFGTILTTPRTWFTAGVIRPNGSGTDATGQLGVAGNVNADNVFNTSVFDMEIGGTSNANMDRLVVAGALTIDGTLRVRFVPGYVPAGGEVYTIITANSITGNFTTLDPPPRTRVIVNPTNVQVEALCTSDQNADGTVDGDDVIDLFAAWDLGLPEADTNGDGSVDGDDVIVFFEHWDAGC